MAGRRTARERIAIYHKTLNAMREPLRDVVILCALDGHSYDVAAEILGISSLKVRAALNCARLEIARALRRGVSAVPRRFD